MIKHSNIVVNIIFVILLQYYIINNVKGLNVQQNRSLWDFKGDLMRGGLLQYYTSSRSDDYNQL